MRDQAGINPWTDASSQLKDTLTENLLIEVPPQDQWRLNYLRKLITQRQEARSLGRDDDAERIDRLIQSLVKN